MAKGRMLQNRISKSQKMASLSSDTARLLYTWMLSHLDVNGNFYADPTMVNNLVFTRLGNSVAKITQLLDELESTGLIIRYEIDGEVYLNYPDFQEKQPKLQPHKESEPDIPNITPESRKTNASVTPPQEKRSKEKRKEKNVILALNDGFEIFWSAYPKKVNRKEALNAWNKAKLPPVDFILSAIEKQKQSEQWENDNGQYIPYPSSWINQERWNDELRPRTPRSPGTPFKKAGGTFTPGGNRIPEISQPAEWKGDDVPEFTPEQRQANIERARELAEKLG